MPTNLFGLIDGIFEGLVFFIYNLASSLALLMRRPLLAPLYLDARYRRKSVKQISPWTLTVLGLVWFQLSITGFFHTSDGDDARAAIPLLMLGEGSPLAIVRLFVISVIAAAFLDILVRSGVVLFKVKSEKHRTQTVGAIQYSAGLTLWIVALFNSALAIWLGEGALDYSLYLVFFGAGATASLIFRFTRGHFRPVRRQWPMWLAFYLAAIVATALSVAGQLEALQIFGAAEAPSKKGLKIVRLGCKIDGKSGTVIVTVWNNDAQPLFRDGWIPSLVFQPFGEENHRLKWSIGTITYEPSIADEQGIAPGAITVFRGYTTFTRPVLTHNGYCRVGYPEQVEPPASMPDEPKAQ